MKQLWVCTALVEIVMQIAWAVKIIILKIKKN